MPIIPSFGGLIPRQSWHLLPENAATVAHNAKLRNGRLEAWSEKVPVAIAPSDSLTFYNWGCCHYYWPQCVSVASYLPDYDRRYITGRIAQPEVMMHVGCVAQYQYLGVPAPVGALTASGVQTDGEESDQRSYVYTYINALGEESAPSPVSNVLTVQDGSAITVSGFSAPPAGWGVIGINLYRTATGYRTGAEKEQQPETDYLFVDTLADTAISYTDSKLMRHLGQAISTRENRVPPALLRHISHLNGTGTLVGVTVNQVHFSENFEPGNWPAEYDLTLPSNIVNMVTLDNWVFITTDGKPFVIDGSFKCEPRQTRTVRDVDIPLPDISCGYAHSAVSTPFGMIYASTDGLIILKPDATFDIITAAWFGTDEWLKLRPDTVRLAYWRGYLICVTDMISFMLEIDGNNYGDFQLGALVTISDKPVDMVVTDGGVLLFLEDSIIYQWDAGDVLRPYIWESRPLSFGAESAPGSIKVDTDGTTVRIMASERPQTYFERFVHGERPIRLPRLGRHLKYRIGLYGTGTTHYVDLGLMEATVNRGV